MSWLISNIADVDFTASVLLNPLHPLTTSPYPWIYSVRIDEVIKHPAIMHIRRGWGISNQFVLASLAHGSPVNQCSSFPPSRSLPARLAPYAGNFERYP